MPVRFMSITAKNQYFLVKPRVLKGFGLKKPFLTNAVMNWMYG